MTAMAVLEPLDPVEARVLGVLVEKELTTPDQYPLTLNALVAGCNQKSNRAPVLALGAGEVAAALERLRLNRLAERLQGSGRVERHRHVARDRLGADAVSIAVLAELLLRGAQTPGELRGRAGRMAAIPALGDLEQCLAALAERGLVRRLPPPAGSRAATWTQLLTEAGAGGKDAPEPAGVTARAVEVRGAAGAVTAPTPAAPARAAGPDEETLAAPAAAPADPARSRPAAPLAERLERLERRLERLDDELGRVHEALETIARRVGVTLEP